MQRYDVLVVGAGLAGLQTSRLLARQGHSVLLVDRKARLDASIHTTGIFVRRTLDDFWLPSECLGPVVRHVRLYSPARRCVSLSSRHDEFRVGRMGRLYCRMLEEALADGVHWQGKTSFLTSQPAGAESRVELECDGSRQSLLARYLVGSDGASSRVARELGLSQNREWIVGVEEVYEHVPLEGPPCLHCFLDPDLAPGYIAWMGHDGEELHLGLGGYPGRFDPQRALDKFRAEAAGMLDLEHAVLVEKRGGRIPVGGVLANIVNDRGLLVGDAAGAASPLTAGGLDPCMRQSALAASVLDQYLTTAEPAALRPYAAPPFRRRFLLRRCLRHALSRVRRPWLAECAFTALQQFPGKSVASQIFFGRGSFPLDKHQLGRVESLERVESQESRVQSGKATTRPLALDIQP